MKSKSAIYILALLFFVVIIVLVMIYGVMKPIFTPGLKVERPEQVELTVEEKMQAMEDLNDRINAADTRSEKEKAAEAAIKIKRMEEINDKINAQKEAGIVAE